MFSQPQNRHRFRDAENAARVRRWQQASAISLAGVIPDTSLCRQQRAIYEVGSPSLPWC